MPQPTQLSGRDPLSRFEPRWSSWFLAVWIAALVCLAAVRRFWPDLLPYESGVELALVWVASFYGIGGISLAFAAARRAQLRRRERAVRDGLCVRCGYDLRASPGRCPECGAEQALATGA